MTTDSNPATTKPAATEPVAHGRKKRRLGKLLLLALVVTVVCVLLAEFVTRMFAGDILPHPSGPRYLYEADDVLGIAHRPGFRGRFKFADEFDVDIAIDSSGFRVTGTGEDGEDPTATRILSLGDSFGFGYGVEAAETYANQLERELNENATEQRRFDVRNGAASGYGTRQMLEILKRNATGQRPKVVVASFFFVNDLKDNVAPVMTERGGIVLTQYFANQVDESAWLRFCFDYSVLGLLATRVYKNYELKTQGVDARLGDPIQFGQGWWGLEYLKKEPPPEIEKQWTVFASLVAELRDESAKHGAKLVMVTIPVEYQLRPELWDRVVAEQAGVGAKTHDPDYPLRRAVEICDAAGVPILELAAALRARKTVDSLYFPINRHFNPTGNRAAAVALAEFLRNRGLL